LHGEAQRTALEFALRCKIQAFSAGKLAAERAASEKVVSLHNFDPLPSLVCIVYFWLPAILVIGLLVD
jgi:hypothetical protein